MPGSVDRGMHSPPGRREPRLARQLLLCAPMKPISSDMLATVCGGESFGQVIRAARSAPDVPLDQTYGQTTSFIRDHAFFHEGVMNLPIGGGKHFRNVPFVGPARIASGALHGSGDAIRKGFAVTQATWDAK